MNDLSHLAQQHFVSIDRLRRFAVTSCGVPADAPTALVDLWLYERLALSAQRTGPHFFIGDDAGLGRAIELSLDSSGGSFEERCAESWAELAANPVARREIVLQMHFGTPRRHQRSDGGAENEVHGDVAGLLLSSQP